MLETCVLWDMDTKPFVEPQNLTYRIETEAETKPSEQYFSSDSLLLSNIHPVSGGLPDYICFS